MSHPTCGIVYHWLNWHLPLVEPRNFPDEALPCIAWLICISTLVKNLIWCTDFCASYQCSPYKTSLGRFDVHLVHCCSIWLVIAIMTWSIVYWTMWWQNTRKHIMMSRGFIRIEALVKGNWKLWSYAQTGPIALIVVLKVPELMVGGLVWFGLIHYSAFSAA